MSGLLRTEEIKWLTAMRFDFLCCASWPARVRMSSWFFAKRRCAEFPYAYILQMRDLRGVRSILVTPSVRLALLALGCGGPRLGRFGSCKNTDYGLHPPNRRLLHTYAISVPQL